MKKFFIAFIVALTAFASVNAQPTVKFTISRDAIFRDVQTGKDYVVIDCPGVSQKDLYNGFLMAAEYFTHVKHGEVFSEIVKVENVSVIIRNLGIGFSYPSGSPDNFTLTYMFQFKEGKVRIEAPILPWEHIHMLLPNSYWHTKFDKDNNWKKPEQLSIINDVINSFINDIVKKALDTTKSW